ncbi:Metallo-dependent phosphatase [Obba rivulosa]|uniref:Metallo-dependent phosphatase n=1 Tax=Obba rivulosa TaxID=1052685 RepID=A0A8E2J5L2_9APHY|nr:Metallo-dependent phosphatase [Obba rivulosa]
MSPSLSSSAAAVYLSYDINSPPPHPGPEWTRFVCISDTHSRIFPVPFGDVLLHAGDLSSGGSLQQLQVTLDWIGSLPHPTKILTAGNHDLVLDDNWREGEGWHQRTGRFFSSKDVDTAQALIRSKLVLDAGIQYLEHESVQITVACGRTWQIYGSPAAPRHSRGAFQYERKDGAAIYEGIPQSTEILLTHAPPYGICDMTRKGIQAGCAALARKLHGAELGHCRLHVFGHIHEAYGVAMTGDLEPPLGKRVSVNAALHSGGQAVIVDLKN